MEVSFLRTTKVIKIASKGFSSLFKLTQEEASYMQEEKLLSRERKKQEEPPKHTIHFSSLVFFTPFVGSSSTTFYTQMQKTST